MDKYTFYWINKLYFSDKKYYSTVAENSKPYLQKKTNYFPKTRFIAFWRWVPRPIIVKLYGPFRNYLIRPIITAAPISSLQPAFNTH